jgi:hypothetical protein
VRTAINPSQRIVAIQNREGSIVGITSSGRQPSIQLCFTREFRRFGPKCSRCGNLISEKDKVQKANGHVYHLDCFKCVICEQELSTGDQFYLIPMDGRLVLSSLFLSLSLFQVFQVCRTDYENSKKGKKKKNKKRVGGIKLPISMNFSTWPPRANWRAKREGISRS